LHNVQLKNDFRKEKVSIFEKQQDEDQDVYNPIFEQILKVIDMPTLTHDKKFQLKTIRNLKQDGMIDQFVHVIKGDDPRLANGLGKPHPRIYELGLAGINEKLGLDIKPEETLVFEDALNGCKAGKAFGGTVCWIPHTEIFGKEEIPEFKTFFKDENEGFVLQSMDKFPKHKFDFQNI